MFSLGFFEFKYVSWEFMRGAEIEPEVTSEGKKILFHGTQEEFAEFKTPTGAEKLDVMVGGVIYLTSDVEAAKKYAGPHDYVCIVEVAHPESYADQRVKQGLPEKQRKYVRNVYIALPSSVEIKAFKRVSEL